MVKTSKLIWYLGLAGVIASGVLNAFFLMETLSMVTIQVPARTLEPYQTIGANDITTKQVSKTSLDADTITSNLVGKVTAMTIPQGDQVQSFELAQQGSMAQVIQHLYTTYPNYAFAQIQAQYSGLSQTIQPGQHVNFVANNMTYSNVWVLSVSYPNGQPGVASAVSQAVNSFVGTSPAQSSGGTMTMLIGAPWSTVQALMAASNAQVVMGNVAAQYSLGQPPANQSAQSPIIPPINHQLNQNPNAIQHVKKQMVVNSHGTK